jgi:lipopolysaccharide biosynthesis glycosyltransferase
LKVACTIITPDYLAYAQALHESLKANSKEEVHLFVFLSSFRINVPPLPVCPDMHFLCIEDLCEEGMGKRLKTKYLNVNVHAFRWSMKSVLLHYLLQKFDKVIFLDGDLFFYNEFEFIYEALNHSRVLLTPHWRSRDPFVDPVQFKEMITTGLFNAGFIAVNRDAMEIMNWWGRLCEFQCSFEPAQGFYADQGYLNLFPIYFEGVEVLRHQGCNVAGWNKKECIRSSDNNNEVLINDKFPIIFIHFTNGTIKSIIRGRDNHLLSYLQKYAATLKRYNEKIDLFKKFETTEKPKKSLYHSAKRFLKKQVKKWLK